MMDDRTSGAAQDAADEPGLTEKNSRTIRGEEILSDREPRAESNLDRETSTRARVGAIPSSYGAAGGTTDATEEGGDGTGI